MDDFESLKREVEEDERRFRQAEGRAAELLSQLKEKFNVKDEDGAEILLAKMELKEWALAKEWAAKLDAYKAEREKRKK